DGGGFERAVVLLVGGSDEDLRARLELALVTGDVGHDHRLRHDHDLLFPLLVLERDFVALHPFHHLRDGGVGHGAVGHQIPRPMTLAGAAHRLGPGKAGISPAFWLPSDCGMPVTPMNELSLMSESAALTIPRTAALSVTLPLYVVCPSRDLPVSTGPSTASTVPRTRTGGG